MKKNSITKTRILFFVCLLSVTLAHGQIVDATQLEVRKKAMFGNTAWKTIASELKPYLSLDNNAIKYVKVIELPGNTKEHLFAKAKRWAESNFNTPESMIRSMNNATNSIVVQGFVNNAVEHIGGSNIYHINLKPIVNIQVKDEKARITFTMSAYNVHKEEKSGSLFRPNSHSEVVWNISKCYPFAEPYVDDHPATSAKALVMTHVCATMYMEAIEKALKSKLSQGTALDDNDSW